MSVQKNAAMTPIIRNAALFAAATREHTFTNMLTGAVVAPKGTKEVGRKQTDAGYPVVRVTDLEKNKGQEITVDMVHRLTGTPTMGDKKLEGRGDTMTFATDTVRINQGRHLIDNGGAMFEKTIGQDINLIAQGLLKGWYKDLDEETTLYHIAGARGSEYTDAMIVPLETHPEFGEIMVNPIVPPTFSRHFYGGDATSISSIDSADMMSLATVDNVALYLEEMQNPIGHVRLDGDLAKDEEPLFIMFVTPRQWRDLQNTASAKDFNQLTANAMKRSNGFNHPIFKGDCLMKNGILVRKMNRRVRFNAGSQVRVCQNNAQATTQLLTAAVNIERAFLLGSQALAYAMGTTKSAKTYMSIHEETVDHGNAKEYSIAFCNGKKPLQFKDKSGFLHDHGRLIIDTAVGN
jgi:N4-gp56 family major capsid protein